MFLEFFSVKVKINVAIESTTATKNTRVSDLDTLSFVNLRPQKLASRFPLRVAQTLMSRMPTVVVLIPPAVDPGVPPINMRIMVKKIPPIEILFNGTV